MNNMNNNNNMSNNKLYKNAKSSALYSAESGIDMRFDSLLHLQTQINAERFERKRGKKRDIFGNTEKKSLLWIGRLTNSTIVLKSRSSRFPFGFFRISLPFSPLSSLTSSLRFSHRLVRISVFVFTATTGG